jgi:hypothetical protein
MFEVENFSGEMVDNIRQDFYAMTTVSNTLSSSLKVSKHQEKNI